LRRPLVSLAWSSVNHLQQEVPLVLFRAAEVIGREKLAGGILNQVAEDLLKDDVIWIEWQERR